MIDGFFDVESRGAFQAFQELRDDGAHLLVVGAHDGVPAGSGGADRQRAAWYDRYLRDVDNGIDHEPAVQLFLANGDREDMLDGRYVTTSGDDWPLPGTTWATLHLDASPSGTATSINDGTLDAGRPRRRGSRTRRWDRCRPRPTPTTPRSSGCSTTRRCSPT